MPGLFKTLLRELARKQPIARTPEPCLVMDAEAAVDAYAQGGREGGALAGAYLYHLAHMCELVTPGDTVLDIGCGPGSLLGQLAELNPRVEFIGMDLSASMLQRAQWQCAEKRLQNVELRYGDMTVLNGIKDGSMDAVVSSMAFHHLPDFHALDVTFMQIARVLKPDGAIYFNDFGRLRHPDSIRYFMSRAADGERQELVDDYFHSLHAAFSHEDFQRVTRRHLNGRARVYATAISPLQVIIKSPALHASANRIELKGRFRALSRVRRADVRQLSLFLRLGGLNSAL